MDLVERTVRVTPVQDNQKHTDIDFEVISYNVRGLSDDRKRKKIMHYLKKHSSGNSVIFLQETHSTSKSQQAFRAQWKGDVIFSHGTSSARGVCIAFRPSLEKKFFSPPI